MLLKALVLFQACLLLCQAELLTRYRSQTTVQVVLKPTDKFPLCKCQANKCELDQKKAEEVCKVLMERFRFYAYPSAYLMLCEVQPKTCTELQSGKPKAYHLDAIFDSFYLRTNPISMDKSSPARALDQVIRKNITFPHVVFDGPPVSAKVTEGITGMPFEFDGELNVPVSDIAKFDVCSESSCRKVINQLCNDFTQSMKTTIPTLMNHFLGCHVRNIYKKDNKVFVSWAMMFHHHNMFTSGVIKKFADLQKFTEQIKSSVKSPSILKNFKITGVVPLDFCEIMATSQTNVKYHSFMQDPTSHPFKIAAPLLYTELTRQILIGGGERPTCLRRVIEMHLDNANGLINAKVRLWVSLSCYKKQGIKTCQDVTKEIDKVWKKGSELAYSFWTPEYKFELVHVNKAYD